MRAPKHHQIPHTKQKETREQTKPHSLSPLTKWRPQIKKLGHHGTKTLQSTPINRAPCLKEGHKLYTA